MIVLAIWSSWRKRSECISEVDASRIAILSHLRVTEERVNLNKPENANYLDSSKKSDKVVKP